MAKQLKSVPFFHVKAADSGRSRTGIAAVCGNIDDGGDRIHSGAFLRTLNNSSTRHKHLWSHGWSHPPIASIKELREIGRSELPAEVLTYAPEATGGLLVTREYYKGDLPDLVLQGIDAGEMEMSIGYEAKQVDYTDAEDGTKIRELKEVQLFETSDVAFGMNSATVAQFAKALADYEEPLSILTQKLQIALHNIKAGARNAAQDVARIAAIHSILLDLGFDKCMMVDETAEKSASNPNASEEPAPVLTDTALRANALKVNDLRLSQLIRRSENVCTSS